MSSSMQSTKDIGLGLSCTVHNQTEEKDIMKYKRVKDTIMRCIQDKWEQMKITCQNWIKRNTKITLIPYSQAR